MGDHIEFGLVVPPDPDGWINATLAVQSGPYSGQFGTEFLAGDLQQLRSGLAKIHRTLSGRVEYETWNRCLVMTIEGDGLGHVTLSGNAGPDPKRPCRLTFRLTLDQTDLPPILATLERANQPYPMPS